MVSLIHFEKFITKFKIMILDILINILKVPTSQAKAAISYFQTTHSLDLAKTDFFELRKLDIIASDPDMDDKVTLHITSYPKSPGSFTAYENSNEKEQVGKKFVEETKEFQIEKIYRGFFSAGTKY